MAVAGCPDYFLHHPNYQVNGNISFEIFFFWEKGKNVLLSSLIKDSNLSWHGCIILLR